MMSHRSTRSRRWAFRLGAVALGCLFALAAAEGVVRLLVLRPQIAVIYKENFRLCDNPILAYELVPGSRDKDDVINLSLIHI